MEKKVQEMLRNMMNEYADEKLENKVRQILKEIIKSNGWLNKSEPKWAKVKKLSEMFGVSKSTVYKDVINMEKNPLFAQYVRQSARNKEISVNGYDKYRQYLSDNYLK